MKNTKNYVPPRVATGGCIYPEAAILTASNPVEVEYSTTAEGQEQVTVEDYGNYWE